MAADCGCGGECPVCSNIGGRLMEDHFFEIHQAVKREGGKKSEDTGEEAENKE